MENKEPTITIRHKKTGEVRNLTVSQARAMGIDDSLIAKKLENRKAVDDAVSGNVSTGTSEQQFKAAAASRAIDELEGLYGRGSSTNVGTDNDLSKNEAPSGFRKLVSQGSRTLDKFLGTDRKLDEDIGKYKSQAQIALGILTQAFGSGTPQEGETKRLMESIPSELSTNAEAKQWFESVRNLMGEAKKKDSTVVTPTTVNTGAPTQGGLPEFSQIEPGAEASLQAPQAPQQPDRLKGALKAIADIAPVAGGVIGGIGGSILGGTAGSIVPGAGTTLGAIGGSAGGTTIGTGAGIALQNTIEDIAGIQDESSKEQLERAVKQPLTAGAIDAATGGIFKAIAGTGGLVLKSIMKGAEDIPLRSIRVSPSQLTNFAKKHVEDLGEFLVSRNILGENALQLATEKASQLQSKFDDLALNDSVKIPLEKLASRFQQEIKDLSPEGGKLVPTQFKDIGGRIAEEWKSIQEQLAGQGITEVSPKMLTELRRGTDELIPNSAFVDPSVKNVDIRLRNIYNSVIHDTAPELKDLGKELSKYYDFMTIAEKQGNLGRGSLMANLPRILTGGGGAATGAALGGPVGAAAGGLSGIALEALLRNPEVLKMIYGASQTASKVGKPVGKLINAASRALSPLTGAVISEKTN